MATLGASIIAVIVATLTECVVLSRAFVELELRWRWSTFRIELRGLARLSFVIRMKLLITMPLVAQLYTKISLKLNFKCS